jgi:PAS domain-containing protein
MLSSDFQKSEDNLRQVIDTIPTLVWCTGPDGSTEFLNKRWHDYTGFSPEESRVRGRLRLAQTPEKKLALLNELQRIVKESKRALTETDLKESK